MTDTLLQRIVLPVASEEDARTTCERVVPRLRDGGSAVLAVHVIEKAGGAPDKASVEQRETLAGEIFAVVEESLDGDGIDVETAILYGTDVAETIRDAADEFDASAIVFTPRGGSRWLKLLTGDTALGLLERATRPVVVLPDTEEGDG
ncbi:MULTISPECIES: universal stress protein [Halorussus]|uniref:universal stress protein n=1 Tax=Halorussus TaxID=1070314 RepID=UPI000E20CA8E|nr:MULTISPECIES: universal stress protein [Halorussus]NHN61369.1 universal stress protein [Halorussus sp. JP-T4]